MEHINEEDFVIRLVEGNIFNLGREQVAAWESETSLGDVSISGTYGYSGDEAVYRADVGETTDNRSGGRRTVVIVPCLYILMHPVGIWRHR